MDYEKKLREIINSNSEYYPSEDKTVFAKYFPELKEDENERIRKVLLNDFKNNCSEYYCDGVNRDMIIAWLEKQGEQMTKPKFHEGDWILNDVCYPLQIASIKDGMYIFTEGDAMSVSFVDEHLHLWTIQDAEDGDVLVNGSNIFIFHYLSATRLMGYCHVNIDNRRFYDDLGKNECFCLIDAVVNPATKEQRELLFQKMKEAGYEWDTEKKEVKKLTDEVEPKFKVGNWFVNNNRKDIFLIKSININGYYTLEDIKGNIISPCLPPCESDSHLWTIEDAKDGDVLATENFIFIFKNIDNGNGVHYYCQYEISKHENDNQFDIALPQSLMGRVSNSISHYSPATKEQRNLLFQKMKEAGYEWDADKKELKKIEIASKESKDEKQTDKDKKEIRRDEVKKNLQEYRSKTFSMKDLVDSFSAYIDKKCKNGPRRWLDVDDKKLVIDAIKNGDWEVIFNLNEKYHE